MKNTNKATLSILSSVLIIIIGSVSYLIFNSYPRIFFSIIIMALAGIVIYLAIKLMLDKGC